MNAKPPRTHLERVLQERRFSITAEVGPAKGPNLDLIRKKSVHCKGYVDAAFITDNQSAVVRMSPVPCAMVLKECGVEPVVQLTCRDRNRMALQSEMLAMVGAGIHNLLCLTGDHQSLGNHPMARGVFDLDSISFIGLARKFADESRFFNGEQFKGAAPLFLGGAANPFAPPLHARVVRLQKKIANGVDFINTQAIFDLPMFDTWLEAIKKEGLHEKVYILAGIVPAKSARALAFMKESISGVFVPDGLITRMEQAKNPEDEAINWAVEMIHELKNREGVAGVHLMPVMWEAAIPEIVTRAGLLPRPESAPQPESVAVR
ncbi:methylenetetrahydrofolate reductase [bacterium]|nr:methylenetetrahydrofolate reductase [bacterium]